MAELHVQKKSGNTWLWISAAIVVLAVLLWVLLRGGSEMNVGAADSTDSARVAAAPNESHTGTAAGTLAGSAVTDYLQFVDQRSSRAAGVSHEYTADGLRHLAAAMTEIAAGDSAGGVALQPRIDAIRERADAIQRNPNSREHARQVREAFVVAAGLIAQMKGQPGSGTDRDLSPLSDASTAIDSDRPLLDQANQIEAFFAEAGESLRDLTNRTR